MLQHLARLSRLSMRRRPEGADVIESCEVVRSALGASDAYVVCAGDPAFTRIGDDSDPNSLEIKQRGYWLIWHHLAADESLSALAFTVTDRLVAAQRELAEANAFTHVACLLPSDESNSEMLVIRGAWARFDEEQTQFLEAARPIIAALVANVLDVERRQRQQAQLRALADVARAFSEASEVDNVVQSVATALAAASGFDWVTVTLVDEGINTVLDRVLNTARHSATTTASDGARPTDLTLPVARQLAATRKPILAPDVFNSQLAPTEDMIAYYQRAHVLSVAVFPLVFQDRLLGTLAFSSGPRRNFTDADVAYLGDLASQAATTIKGVRLYQELEEASRIQHFQARTDALTGIPNRRYIEEVLRAECARAQRYTEPLTVVMADLDHFKRINDGFGHQAGDEALRHVAEVARASCREVDFVGRWGGDEFVFILPVTPMDRGLVFAERFRTLLKASAFAPPGQPAWSMTVSAGVAEARVKDHCEPEALFRLADTALYAAKEGGRDRVVPAEYRAAAA